MKNVEKCDFCKQESEKLVLISNSKSDNTGGRKICHKCLGLGTN